MDSLAIELDGIIQSDPQMNEPSFSGGVEISGDFSEGEARNLARVLNSGSLPVQLTVESIENVSPTLGKDSLRAAWISGLVGVGLVLIFMVLYYRMLGFIVAVGVTVSASLLWSVISLLSRDPGSRPVAVGHRRHHRLRRRHRRLLRRVLRAAER